MDYLILDRIGESEISDLVILKNIPYEGVTIGRDGCNFIKIKDITVSRTHACIKYNGGEFVLFDEDSKFGTTVHEPEQLEVEVGKYSKCIQFEDSLLRISIKLENK